MESEAELFFWPNAGRYSEIVSSRASADSTLRLLVTKQLLSHCVGIQSQAEEDNATDLSG